MGYITMFRPPVAPSYQPPPLGRRRTRHFDLPPRMARKGGSYYYVTNDKPRRWLPLGNDLNRARRRWAELECSAQSVTVAGLLEAFLADCGDDWRPATRRQYEAFAATLTTAFGDAGLDELTTPELARWRDANRHRRIWVNGCLSLLRSAYAKAVEWDWSETNPALAVKSFAPRKRGRYLTDAEFRAIRAKVPPWLADAMDIAYLTALRESDVLSLRWSDVGDVLTVRQIKTGAKQAFVVSPELRAVLERCRAKPIVGLYVIATEKGRPIKQRRLQNTFLAATRAAGVADAIFHDIRGKAATDAKADGIDYQALLGHTDPRMSERYVRRHETPRVQTLRRKL